jgi:hypothetical protein
MNLFGPVARAVAIVVPLMMAGAGPAWAGPAEMALLEQYIGSWNGKSVLQAAKDEPVTCKMSLSKGNGTKLNFTGRCSMAGAQISVAGTIAYVEANRRYEAAMTTGMGGFRGVAIGQKRGETIVFDLKDKAKDDSGNDVTINSSVTLKGGNSMSVTFKAVFNQTGDSMATQIPFTKS